jgi:hypothetical protein
MMQLRETTARSIDEFVSIACGLGRDAARRGAISSQIAANKSRLYRDGECIAGLETFLKTAVRGKRAQS